MNTKHIPGQDQLFNGRGEFLPCVLLLIGPPGSGKTLYCMEFLKEGAAAGQYCAYINCSQSLTRAGFASYFVGMEDSGTGIPKYCDLFSPDDHNNSGAGIQGGAKISELLKQVTDFISSLNRIDETMPMRIVLDSITNLTAKYSSDEVDRFVSNFYDSLKKQRNVMALLTQAATSASAVGNFGSLLDGIIQLRMQDSGEEIRREVRILSLKTTYNTPRWVPFQVGLEGALRFGREAGASEESTCKLCDRQILGPAVQESGSFFHPACFDTYRKLGELYGSRSMFTLQPGVVNANFFFIDIVGLSDPLLSVESQIRKIGDLNTLIGSCDAFSKVPNDAKIILPTGDGMAIGFLLNPELPLQLSIQLHQKLRAFNSKQPADRRLGVRIGLSSGPVFVVRDINNNQNVWGPGIILARRVMDLGDDGHILLADNIADSLRNLKDEYRGIIKLVTTDHKIKHGAQVGLYSAYSQDFGNPAKPARL